MFTRKSFKVMPGLGKIIKPRKGIKTTYPILILCGDNDIELVKHMSIKWQQDQPEHIFKIIVNVGHCANMDAPEIFNTIVHHFISNNH